MTTRQYKDFKNLKKENLIDNMSTLELILNMIAEATTTEITQTLHPQGLEENKKVAKWGGELRKHFSKERCSQTAMPFFAVFELYFGLFLSPVQNQMHR